MFLLGVPAVRKTAKQVLFFVMIWKLSEQKERREQQRAVQTQHTSTENVTRQEILQSTAVEKPSSLQAKTPTLNLLQQKLSQDRRNNNIEVLNKLIPFKNKHSDISKIHIYNQRNRNSLNL